MMTYEQQYRMQQAKIKEAERNLRMAEHESDAIMRKFCFPYGTVESIIQSARVGGDAVFVDAVVMYLLSQCENDAEKDAVLQYDTTPYTPRV